MPDLEDQISQITNPDDFVKVCNSVLSAEYGSDYQVVDGTRGDDGNDGFVRSTGELFAIYCPIKPERRTDRDYLHKIKSDFAKAFRLHQEGQLHFKKWTFVTPRKLSAAVIAAMEAAAKDVPFAVGHVESTYLSNLLYRHSELVEKFPFLHMLKVGEKLTEILDWIHKASPPPDVASVPSAEHTALHRADKLPSEDNRQVLAIRATDQTETSKKQLRSIFYLSADLEARLNAVLGLVQWWDPVQDKTTEMIDLCDHGLVLARQLEAKDIEAFLLAQKGLLLSFAWVMKDVETWGLVQMTNVTGISLITEAQRLGRQEQQKELERLFTRSFNEALERCRECQSVRAWAEVLICIGNAAGQRAAHLGMFGFRDQADSEKSLSKRALLAARDLYAQHGNELGAAYALHNLANQLSRLGEADEAREITTRVLEVAQRCGDSRLEQTATWVKDELETGRIPDYVSGERRERKK